MEKQMKNADAQQQMLKYVPVPIYIYWDS
jgi:hypothetical protein